MYSKIDIINLALANLSNQNAIQHLDEKNPEAYQVLMHWDVVLDTALAAFPWSFASREKELTPLAESGSGDTYHHTYPTDCVKIRRVYLPEMPSRGIPFSISRSDDNKFKVIKTLLAPVVAAYTTREVPATELPGDFANAFAWRLAAEIALAKRADPQMASSALQAYAIHLEKAKLHDAEERGAREKHLTPWMRARHG